MNSSKELNNRKQPLFWRKQLRISNTVAWPQILAVNQEALTLVLQSYQQVWEFWWFKWEMSPKGSDIWIFSLQLIICLGVFKRNRLAWRKYATGLVFENLTLCPTFRYFLYLWLGLKVWAFNFLLRLKCLVAILSVSLWMLTLWNHKPKQALSSVSLSW